MKVGETESLDISVIDDLKKYLTIASSNPDIAEVSDNSVKALSVGYAKVTADLNNGKRAEIDVVVYNVEASHTKDIEDVSANSQVSALINKILEGNNVEGIDETTKNKIIQAIQENKTIKTYVSTASVNENNITNEAGIIKEVLKENQTVATYYDINVLVKANEEELGKITTLKTEIPITVEIPNNLPKLAENVTREFKMISLHDNEAKELETTNNGDGTVTFKAKDFSIYVLTYTDTTNTTQTGETNETNATNNETNVANENINANTTTQQTARPFTGDTIVATVFVLLAAIIGVVATNKLRKDTMSNDKK